MRGKKILFLFLALLLPICVFLFLKIFGKNEFAVPPLYQDIAPEVQADCPPVKLPYHVSAQIIEKTFLPDDSLGLIYFQANKPARESQNQISRIQEYCAHYPLTLTTSDSIVFNNQLRKCIFFLKEPFDMVLIDRVGTIRGQYASGDREDVDRLITEIDIILKKY